MLKIENFLLQIIMWPLNLFPRNLMMAENAQKSEFLKRLISMCDYYILTCDHKAFFFFTCPLEKLVCHPGMLSVLVEQWLSFDS